MCVGVPMWPNVEEVLSVEETEFLAWLDKEEMRLMQEGKTDTRLPGKHSFNAPRTVSVSV